MNNTNYYKKTQDFLVLEDDTYRFDVYQKNQIMDKIEFTEAQVSINLYFTTSDSVKYRTDCDGKNWERNFDGNWHAVMDHTEIESCVSAFDEFFVRSLNKT